MDLQSTQNKWILKDASFWKRCLLKLSLIASILITMAAVSATKEPEYLDEEGNKKETHHCAYLSLGAGVQSSCLALMAQEGLTKHKPDYMIFADTGWEPSFVYEHVEYLKESHNDLPTSLLWNEATSVRILIRAANPIKGSNEEHGNLSPDAYQTLHCLLRNVLVERLECLYRQCTHDYKVIPIQKEDAEKYLA